MARDAKFMAVNLVGFLIIGTMTVIASPNNGLGWFFLNIFLFYICSFVLTVIHESAHAAAAIAVKAKPTAIAIGAGKKLWEKKIFGIPITFNAFLVGGGLTFVVYPTIDHIRLKHAAVVAAGPLSNLIITGLLILLLGPAIQHPHPEHSGLYPLAALFVANLFMLGSSIIPHRVKIGGHFSRSDGMQLFWLLTRKSKDHLIVAAHFYPKYHRAAETGDYSEARSYAVKALTHCPEQDAVRAETLNLIAWCDVLSGHAGYTKEAELYATEALRLAPENWGAKGTLGSIYIDSDRAAEGLALMLESNEQAILPAHQASNLCYIAIAHQRMGNTEAAIATAREAANLDPKCPLLPRTRDALRLTAAA